MAESEKKDSSSVSSKEKNLLLDIDIGKDFLNAWEPISVAKDDGMDFDIMPVSKANKKPIDFGKADFDFNWDGDFGKISSFNIDMSDLGISPPLKKDEKSKEKLNESSSEKEKGKSAHFDFDFDFDKIGEFNFEPSVTGDDSRSQGGKNNKESSLDGKSGQDKEGSMCTDLNGNMSTIKGVPQEPSLPEPFNFDMDCPVGRSKDVENPKEKFTANVTADVAFTSVNSAARDELASDRRSESSQRTIASTELPKTKQSERMGFAEQVKVNTCAGNDAKLDLSFDHLLDNELKNSSVAEEKTDCMDPNPTGSNIKQDVHLTSVSDLSDNSRCTVQEESQSLQSFAVPGKNHCEKNEAVINDCVMVPKERLEPGGVNSHVEKHCARWLVVSEMISKMPSARESLETASENLKLVPSARQPNDQSEKEAMKRREPLVTCLRSFLQSEKLECPGRKAATQNTLSLSSSKVAEPTEPSAVEGRELDGIQGSKKLLSLKIQHSHSTRLLKDLPQTHGQENYKALKISEEVSADGLSDEKQPSHCSAAQRKEIVKTKSALRQGEISAKDLHTLGSAVDIGNKSVQNRPNPTSLSSITTKYIRPEEKKLSSIEKRKETSELPALKLSGLNLGSNKPHILQDLKSGANTNVVKVSSTKPALEIIQASNSQKQIPNCLSDKRKALEKDAVDSLHPAKRLCDSLTASRDLAKTSETIRDKVVFKEDNCIKSALGNSQASIYQMPPKDKTGVIVMPCITETGSNIKLAEAYVKELDDLCNALKKRNGEAKELLVRAIVNNNKLLMLNTPTFKQKIHATQKLFSELTFNTNQGGTQLFTI